MIYDWEPTKRPTSYIQFTMETENHIHIMGVSKEGWACQALEMYEIVFKIHAAAYDTHNHIDVASALYNMAGLYEAQGVLNKALDAF